MNFKLNAVNLGAGNAQQTNKFNENANVSLKDYLKKNKATIKDVEVREIVPVNGDNFTLATFVLNNGNKLQCSANIGNAISQGLQIPVDNLCFNTELNKVVFNNASETTTVAASQVLQM